MPSDDQSAEATQWSIEDTHPAYVAGWSVGIILALVSVGVMQGAEFNWALLAFAGGLMSTVGFLGASLEAEGKNLES